MFSYFVSLKYRWAVGGALPLAIVLLGACLALFKHDDSASRDALRELGLFKGDDSASREALRKKAKGILADSRSQANIALANRLRDVRAVFERGRGGADAFAEDALSWSGKWRWSRESWGSARMTRTLLSLRRLFPSTFSRAMT